MIQQATNNEIILNGKATGYTASQTLGGTRVRHVVSGKTLTLPKNRYSLSCENPASGVPGKSEFESDFVAAIGA